MMKPLLKTNGFGIIAGPVSGLAMILCLSCSGSAQEENGSHWSFGFSAGASGILNPVRTVWRDPAYYEISSWKKVPSLALRAGIGWQSESGILFEAAPLYNAWKIQADLNTVGMMESPVPRRSPFSYHYAGLSLSSGYQFFRERNTRLSLMPRIVFFCSFLQQSIRDHEGGGRSPDRELPYPAPKAGYAPGLAVSIERRVGERTGMTLEMDYLHWGNAAGNYFFDQNLQQIILMAGIRRDLGR